MDARLRQTVRDRAESRCEFCHLPERIAELPFQIDHVIAEQHGGLTSEDNLAFACARCNRYKGPNLSGIDPESGTITHLFNPRIDNWSEHFFGTRRGWPRELRSDGPLLLYSTSIIRMR